MRPNIARGRVALVLAFALVPLLGAAQDKPAEPAKPAALEKDATPDKAAMPAAAPKTEAVHPFALIAGSWSGGGTISLSGGTRERLRCRAHHKAGHGNKTLSLSIRCASDSYRFDLTSSVVDRRGQIFGRWSESSNGVSGSISGRAVGNRISAVAHSDSFTAGLSLTTNGNRQSVSITPRNVYITGVYIALSRR